MKELIYVVFYKLLSDPLNDRICKWGLAICAGLFFGNMIIHYLIQIL